MLNFVCQFKFSQLIFSLGGAPDSPQTKPSHPLFDKTTTTIPPVSPNLDEAEAQRRREIAGNASTRLEEGQRCVRSLVERHQIGHVVGTLKRCLGKVCPVNIGLQRCFRGLNPPNPGRRAGGQLQRQPAPRSLTAPLGTRP